MIANRLRCSACYLSRAFTFNKKLNIKKSNMLFRLCYSQSLKSFVKHLYPTISKNIYLKYSSQTHNILVKPFETNIHDNAEKGKLFFETENEFYHDVLKSKERYKKIMFFSDNTFLEQADFHINEQEFNDIVNKVDWSCVAVENIVESFIKATVYSVKHLKLPISDVLFKNLCIGLVQVSCKLNDEQLFNSLKSLLLWPPCDGVKADNFLDVWKALDKTCYLRIVQRSWDIDTSLYVMDLWYALKLTRLSEFVYRGQIRLSRKVLSFKPHQLVLMFFFMNISRKIHPGISMYEYEYVLEKSIPDLSLEEIAIAAGGFFKTQTRISSEKCLSLLVKRLTDEADTAHNITISSLLKVVRYSFKSAILKDLNLLITALIPRMDSNTLTGCIHTVLALTPMQIFNERAINKLVEKFLENPASARLKDMEKMTFILSLFNYIPSSAPHVLQTIVNELNRPKREAESNEYRHSLINLLFFLSILQVYPQHLIAKVLDETWLTETFGKHPYKIDRTLLGLDYNVELECPDAKVPHLPYTTRKYIAKKSSWYIPTSNKKHLSYYDRMFIDIVNAMEKIISNNELYLIHYPLPHYGRPDIIYCLDNDNKPMPIPEEMRNNPFHSGILKPTCPGNWRCIVVGSRSMYPCYDQTLIGEQAAKIRQLKIIGYTPVVIQWYYWDRRDKNVFADYLKQQIFSKV